MCSSELSIGMGSETAAGWVAGVMKSIEFPAAEGSELGKVTYPFIFRRPDGE